MTLLERLQGTGLVTTLDGKEIPAKYDIRITQDDSAAGVGTPPGRKHISGEVWAANDPYFVPTHLRQNMTLQMEDGRKISFFHRDSDGGIGLHKWIG